MPNLPELGDVLNQLAEPHAHLLRTRLGLEPGGPGARTPEQAAAVLGMDLDTYRKAEQEAVAAAIGLEGRLRI